MNDSGKLIVEEVELAGAIEAALREAVARRERSDDRLVEIAAHARTMASERTDQAFAAALRSSLEALDARWDLKCEILVAAEQLAHLAGASRFSDRTCALLAELRSGAHAQDHTEREPEAGRAAAAFRGYVLALARTVGMSVTPQDLTREVGLRTHEPTLWLDLAVECFAAGAYVDAALALLENDRFSPFELVRSLPMIVRHQGVSTAQKVLDAACGRLHDQGRDDDAKELIGRAEAFEPGGWRLPPSEPEDDKLQLGSDTS